MSGREGFVYILSNPSMPGIIKVGMTQTVPSQRIKDSDLSATGIPTPFVVEYYAFFHNMVQAEKKAHQSLRQYHHGKEFFKTDIANAIAAIEGTGLDFKRIFSKIEHDKKLEEIQKLKSEMQEKERLDKIRIEEERLANKITETQVSKNEHQHIEESPFQQVVVGIVVLLGVLALFFIVSPEGKKYMQESPNQLVKETKNVVNMPPASKSKPKLNSPIPDEKKEEVNFLLQVVRQDPANLNAQIQLGNIYMDAKQYREAIEHYSKALSIDPGNIDVRISRGICYRNLGMLDVALQEYSKGLELNPSLPQLYIFLAEIYMIKNDYAKAIDYYSIAIYLDANNPDLYIARAVTYMQTEQWQLADTDIDKSITINPNNWLAFYNKACIYSLTSRMSEALIYLKRSIELNSDAKSKAKMDRDFDSLRSDQRFQMLIQ